MRKIDLIVLHCSDSKASQHFTAEDVRRWHKKRGWSDIGYHFLIKQDGEIEDGRPLHKVGAHAKGYNTGSIGIMYYGGVKEDGTSGDTRTREQKLAMERLIKRLRSDYGSHIRVKGHNQMSNTSKTCPNFNVPKWLKTIAFMFAALTVLSGCSASYHLKKAIQKDPTILVADTVEISDTVRLTTELVELDTVFSHSKDTITIIKDNLTVKYYQTHDSVYIYGKCDTIFTEVIREHRIPYEKIVYKPFNKVVYIGGIASVIIGAIFIYWLIGWIGRMNRRQ